MNCGEGLAGEAESRHPMTLLQNLANEFLTARVGGAIPELAKSLVGGLAKIGRNSYFSCASNTAGWPKSAPQPFFPMPDTLRKG